jgi:hypothetical protein
MASGDAAIAFEAVPAPVAPKQRGSKKPNKRMAKTDRGEDAKKRPKKASRSKGNAVAKKSKKKSVTKRVVGAAKKAKKTVKKATKKKKIEALIDVTQVTHSKSAAELAQRRLSGRKPAKSVLARPIPRSGWMRVRLINGDHRLLLLGGGREGSFGR